MSNKLVPHVYRTVIDDVIASIKTEFDEYGVGEDVLADLQHKWQNKVMASHVAEFEVAAPQHPPPTQAYPAHPMHMMHQGHPHYAHNPYAPQPPPPQGGAAQVKTEPVDNRYVLNPPQGMAYIPPLPGPPLAGPRPPHPGGQQGVLSFSAGPPRPQPIPITRPYAPPGPQIPNGHASPAPAQPARIPQVDGPSSSSSESPSPPPSQSYAPHSSHPSLPQPSQTSTSAAPDDSEAINSDLDDSDTEGEEDADDTGPGESDIVFCTYDKVARVKNKWKCILKDGMIHINGRDYLFAKCTGEFEW